MKIAVAGDSAGEGLAKILAEHLAESHDVVEMSRTDTGPDAYYADLANRVASAVIDGEFERAILVCGTGIGVCMSANKVPGIPVRRNATIRILQAKPQHRITRRS